MACQCLVGCGTSVHNSREIIILVLVAAYVLATHSEGILSATNVLVRMLMKGAAKCNNHCELQNSVNQLTIERRSALGAFLRACLCQRFHIYNSECPLFWTWWLCIKLNACCIKCYCLNVLDLLLDVVVHTPAPWSVWTWHQAKQPAEFKHISKWRIWNQMGILK